MKDLWAVWCVLILAANLYGLASWAYLKIWLWLFDMRTKDILSRCKS